MCSLLYVNCSSIESCLRVIFRLPLTLHSEQSQPHPVTSLSSPNLLFSLLPHLTRRDPVCVPLTCSLSAPLQSVGPRRQQGRSLAAPGAPRGAGPSFPGAHLAAQCRGTALGKKREPVGLSVRGTSATEDAQRQSQVCTSPQLHSPCICTNLVLALKGSLLSAPWPPGLLIPKVLASP